MKHKKLFCLALVFAVAFSVFTVTTHLSNAAAAPILSVVPTGDPGATSTTFTHGPTAIVSILNGTTYETGDQIVLDGRSSTPGYDAQSAESCPITGYVWLVQYENDSLFGAYSGSGVTIVLNSVAWLQITLIVTAPDVNSSPNSQYTNISTTSVWINVELPQQLAKIVVTTTQLVYGPQQLVQLYANVTFNGAPVANQDVAFTVLDPNGTIISITTSLANATGIAYQQYRAPWSNSSNPDFGTWSVIASVDISQVVVTDTVSFEYYYLATVTTNGITLPTNVARGSTMSISVTIQNADNITLPSTVTISIYDQNDVLIGSYLQNITNAGAGTTLSATFTIPTWAFVGEATVYVNILSASPLSSGVPLSPEQTANFQITS